MKLFFAIVLVALSTANPYMAFASESSQSFVKCILKGKQIRGDQYWSLFSSEEFELNLKDQEKAFAGVAFDSATYGKPRQICTGVVGTNSSSVVKVRTTLENATADKYSCGKNNGPSQQGAKVYEDSLSPGQVTAFVADGEQTALIIVMLDEIQKKELYPSYVCEKYFYSGALVMPYKGKSPLKFSDKWDLTGDVDSKGVFTVKDSAKSYETIIQQKLPLQGAKLPLKSLSVIGGREGLWISLEDSAERSFEYAAIKIGQQYLMAGKGFPLADIPSRVCPGGSNCEWPSSVFYDILTNSKGQYRLLFYVRNISGPYSIEKYLRTYDFESLQLVSSVEVKTNCTNSDWISGSSRDGQYWFYNNNRYSDGSWCKTGTKVHFDQQQDTLIVDDIWSDSGQD